MSLLSTRLPVPVGGRPEIAGCPYHGLLNRSALTLELPNGHTIDYPANPGPHAALLRRPGMPDVSRTPEQAAADATAGYQWWNVAILGLVGSRGMLYGQPLHTDPAAVCWIYIADDGSRWRCCWNVSGAPAPAMETDLSVTVTVRTDRFGEFGGSPDAHTLSDTVVDATGGGGAVAGDPNYRVMDIDSRGRQVLIACNPHARIAAPVSVILLTMGGSGATLSLDAALLYGYSQCLPAITETGASDTTTTGRWHCPIGDVIDTTYEQDGETVTIRTATPGGIVDDPGLCPTTAQELLGFAQSWFVDASGRLLSCAFNDLDEVVDFRLNARYESSLVQPVASIATSGSMEYRFWYPDGTLVCFGHAGGIDIQYTLSAASSEAVRLTLLRDGSPVAESLIESECTVTAAHHSVLTYSGCGGIDNEFSSFYDRQRERRVDGDVVWSDDTHNTDYWVGATHFSSFPFDALQLSLWYLLYGHQMTDAGGRRCHTVGEIDDPLSPYLHAKRETNKLATLIQGDPISYLDALDVVDEWGADREHAYKGFWAPDGQDASQHQGVVAPTVYHAGYSPLSAVYNPVTFDVAIEAGHKIAYV